MIYYKRYTGKLLPQKRQSSQAGSNGPTIQRAKPIVPNV